jgi:hypothetical protein
MTGTAAWIAIGLVCGLVLGASAQVRYTYYYDSSGLMSKAETLQRGYVAGVFDSMKAVVRENDGHSRGLYSPTELANAYTCLQRAQTTGELVDVARQLWAQEDAKELEAASVIILSTSSRCPIRR